MVLSVLSNMTEEELEKRLNHKLLKNEPVMTFPVDDSIWFIPGRSPDGKLDHWDIRSSYEAVKAAVEEQLGVAAETR
jgi:hypothetical protein